MSEIEAIISGLRAWVTGTKSGSAPLYKPTAKRLLAYIELLEESARHPFGRPTIPTAAARPPTSDACPVCGQSPSVGFAGTPPCHQTYGGFEAAQMAGDDLRKRGCLRLRSPSCLEPAD